MVDDEIWQTRDQRRRRPYQPRNRRPCVGELVQIDGCDHEWFEDRAPRCTLLVYIDDATSRIQELQFVHSESAFDYFESSRRYILRHGKPVAFYSDKHSIFHVVKGGTKTGDGVTQFGRALGELNIDIVCANSPQAKGRVERANLTLQDRLVKELRRQNVSSMEAGNAFLTDFAADYNARFAKPPKSDHNAHRPLRETDNLKRAFTWQEERTLSKDLVLHYKRVRYLIEPGPKTNRLAGKRCQIFEQEDGSIDICCLGRSLPFRAFDKAPHVDQGEVVANKHLGAVLDFIKQKQELRDKELLQSKNLTKREKLRHRQAQSQRLEI